MFAALLADRFRLNKVVALVSESNAASSRLLGRLGFQPEGLINPEDVNFEMRRRESLIFYTLPFP